MVRAEPSAYLLARSYDETTSAESPRSTCPPSSTRQKTPTSGRMETPWKL
ncbi:MAG: hypothetical protein ACLFU8_05150 [Anaerolineales bacterium]